MTLLIGATAPDFEHVLAREVATGQAAEPRRFPTVLVRGADGVVHRSPFDGIELHRIPRFIMSCR